MQCTEYTDISIITSQFLSICLRRECRVRASKSKLSCKIWLSVSLELLITHEHQLIFTLHQVLALLAGQLKISNCPTSGLPLFLPLLPDLKHVDTGGYRRQKLTIKGTQDEGNCWIWAIQVFGDLLCLRHQMLWISCNAWPECTFRTLCVSILVY